MQFAILTLGSKEKWTLDSTDTKYNNAGNIEKLDRKQLIVNITMFLQISEAVKFGRIWKRLGINSRFTLTH